MSHTGDWSSYSECTNKFATGADVRFSIMTMGPFIRMARGILNFGFQCLDTTILKQPSKNDLSET